MSNEPHQKDGLRIDKWLWSARFYKTRGLANQAIAAGHIDINGNKPKPSRCVTAGDRLTIRRGTETIELEVIALSERRGPATEAATLYAETPHSIEQRELARQDRALLKQSEAPTTRPTKRDRRMIERWMGGAH